MCDADISMKLFGASKSDADEKRVRRVMADTAADTTQFSVRDKSFERQFAGTRDRPTA